MLDIHHRNSRNIFPQGVRVYVSDLSRSHEWYRDVLGLHMEMLEDAGCSVYYSELGDGSRIPVFWLVPGLLGPGRHSTVSLAFYVGDITGTLEQLRALKVTVVSEPHIQAGVAVPTATILDPDGHGIVLHGS